MWYLKSVQLIATAIPEAALEQNLTPVLLSHIRKILEAP